jgi:hypothetical protein
MKRAQKAQATKRAQKAPAKKRAQKVQTTMNESDEGSGNNDIAHDAAPTREEPITNDGDKDHFQESSNASIAERKQ